jgi:hypothetical protein
MERKDIEYFFIWTTIKGAKTRFRSLSAIGECAKHGCASSPTMCAFGMKMCVVGEGV